MYKKNLLQNFIYNYFLLLKIKFLTVRYNKKIHWLFQIFFNFNLSGLICHEKSSLIIIHVFWDHITSFETIWQDNYDNRDHLFIIDFYHIHDWSIYAEIVAHPYQQVHNVLYTVNTWLVLMIHFRNRLGYCTILFHAFFRTKANKSFRLVS